MQLQERHLIGLAPLGEVFMKLQEGLGAVVPEGLCFRMLDPGERLVLKTPRRKVKNYERNLWLCSSQEIMLVCLFGEFV